MLIIICRDHGNIKLTSRQVKDQQAAANDEERWRCPICNLFASCVDIMEVAIGMPCLACKARTTIKSLWDERHKHFFCSVLCVGDYDQMLKDTFQNNRASQDKGGATERIQRINRARRRF